MPYKDPEVRRNYRKKWGQTNREKLNEYERNRCANSDQAKNSKKEYAATHREQHRKSNKLYWQKNKENIKLRAKKYRVEHRDRIKTYRQKYVTDNMEKVAISKAKSRIKRKSKILEYCRQKRKTDINFKLRDCLRCRLYQAVKNKAKSGSAVKDLGCTIKQFKLHIESQFQVGMFWSNYGSEWHLDHIKPLSRFDLTDRTQFLQACNFTNLQPLWKLDNLRKNNKWEAA